MPKKDRVSAQKRKLLDKAGTAENKKNLTHTLLYKQTYNRQSQKFLIHVQSTPMLKSQVKSATIKVMPIPLPKKNSIIQQQWTKMWTLIHIHKTRLNWRQMSISTISSTVTHKMWSGLTVNGYVQKKNSPGPLGRQRVHRFML